jgi:hypothetical protein
MPVPIDPDELSDLIADVRMLLDPQPALSRQPTVQEIAHAAAAAGWLPPLGDPYMRPALPARPG